MAVIEAIRTVYVEAAVSTVTISSIPNTYEHLQLYLNQRGTYASTGLTAYLRLNGDTGTNYSGHELYTSGSGVGTLKSTNLGYWDLMTTGSTNPASEYVVQVVDLYDYANTNKYTTMHHWQNKTPRISFYCTHGGGTWESTSAVSSIAFSTYGANVERGSVFTLYGLKSAN